MKTLWLGQMFQKLCLHISSSLRLSQDRTRAILSVIDPNDSAAKADTQRFYHLQAKIHKLFITLTDRIDQFPDPNVSNSPPSVPTPPPAKQNFLEFLFLNSMGNFLHGRISGDYFPI